MGLGLGLGLGLVFEELEGRTIRLAEGGGEDSGVERRQWLLELRRDKGERLVLDVEGAEELHCLRDARGVEPEEACSAGLGLG